MMICPERVLCYKTSLLTLSIKWLVSAIRKAGIEFLDKLPGSILYIVFSIISFHTIANASPTFDFRGQLSSKFLAVNSSSEWHNTVSIRYLPDFTIQKVLSDDLLWDFNVSANIFMDYESHPESDVSSAVHLYRLNTQIKTPQSDTRLGLQKINFGPALLLRSLRWFDQVKPMDLLELTEGVTAIRYRYFFVNNANIWLWALYGNNEPKGYERVATKENSLEAGARFQYPCESGEVGLSVHGRQTESLGFSDELVGEDLFEKRIALDGKWDLGPGIWFEYVLIDQGAESQSDSNWVNMLTIGADYTFALGNGIYILAEHLVNSTSKEAVDWDNTGQISALQLSYPLTILDSVSLIQMYSWTQKQSFHYLSWNRTYDDWVLSISIILADDEVDDIDYLGFSGNGIQAMLVFHH